MYAIYQYEEGKGQANMNFIQFLLKLTICKNIYQVMVQRAIMVNKMGRKLSLIHSWVQKLKKQIAADSL